MIFDSNWALGASCPNGPGHQSSFPRSSRWSNTSSLSSSLSPLLQAWKNMVKKLSHTECESLKKWSAVLKLYVYCKLYIYIPRAPTTSIFEGQPPKTRPKFQPKPGSFGFQVCIYIIYSIFIYVHTYPRIHPRKVSFWYSKVSKRWIISYWGWSNSIFVSIPWCR